MTTDEHKHEEVIDIKAEFQLIQNFDALAYAEELYHQVCWV